MFLPSHYTKIADVGIVTSDGTVVIDRGRGLKVFLQPFSKCSSCNKNIDKYHLPHVWDEVLINNIELKLK